jgi:hypothetical protein
MLRWALWIVGGAVAIVAIIAIIGALLPKEHVATRAAKFRESPDAVWSAITTFQDYPKWRPGLQSVEQLSTSSGHAVWLERTGTGWNAEEIPYQVVELVAPTGETPGRMVARIADPKLPFGGSWTYEVTASADGGTILRITERGEVYNPIFRFVSKFFMSQTKTMEVYLNALGKKFGETVTISE